MAKKSQVDIENSNVVPRTGYTDTLVTITKEGICPFCEENLTRHHSKPILFKNKEWIVTKNAWPYEGTKHHFLLISRTHIEDAKDASPDTWEFLGAAYKRLCKDYKLKGATLFMRSGDTRYTSASVKHLHAQVISGSARTEGSSIITALVGFGPKK
jgi:ATP adenylyltransferase